MWNDIIEIIVEGILEASTDNANHKRNAILIGLSSLAWLSAIILFLWGGIADDDISMVGLGLALLTAFLLWLYAKIKRYYKTKTQSKR